MGLVLALSAVSFTVFIIGHIMTSMQITSLEGRLERLQNSMDKVA
jgi:hypothetical protein